MPARKKTSPAPTEAPTVGERAIESGRSFTGHLVPMDTPSGVAFIAPLFIQIISQPMLYDGARPRGPGRRPKVDPSSPSASWCRWITTRDGQRLVVFDSAENFLKLGLGTSWPASSRSEHAQDEDAASAERPLPYGYNDDED